MKWHWGRLWCIFNWRSFEETRMECFNSIRRRPLSAFVAFLPPATGQAGRQAAQSCNWAAVKGAGNVRFLGPNCHFVCKFELWKCWAWKWEIAANNCWIRPCSQSCRCCVVSLACNLAKIYMYVCILWAMQEITESSGICWVNDACQPLPRLVARLQLLPQHTPTLIHATSVATLAPQETIATRS